MEIQPQAMVSVFHQIEPLVSGWPFRFGICANRRRARDSDWPLKEKRSFFETVWSLFTRQRGWHGFCRCQPQPIFCFVLRGGYAFLSCRKPLCLQVAEYLVGILDSFERSTTRKLVVSASDGLGFSTTCPILRPLTDGSPTSTTARPGPSSTARASSRGGLPSNGPRGGKSRSKL